MTRYRGYKRETSKSGEAEYSERNTRYAVVDVQDLLIRDVPNGKVVTIVHKGDKVEIIDYADSIWVRVATPSGYTGYAGSRFLVKEVQDAI